MLSLQYTHILAIWEPVFLYLGSPRWCNNQNPQVVTLATYLFFIFTLIGRQKIQGFGVRDNGKDVRMASGRIPIDIDLYIPIFTVLQFFFYMGLLKVAEQLINPFGDDDEDFELNWLIDRHVKVKFSAKSGQNTLCSSLTCPSSCLRVLCC